MEGVVAKRREYTHLHTAHAQARATCTRARLHTHMHMHTHMRMHMHTHMRMHVRMRMHTHLVEPQISREEERRGRDDAAHPVDILRRGEGARGGRRLQRNRRWPHLGMLKLLARDVVSTDEIVRA